MNAPAPSVPVRADSGSVCQPCSEACAAFHPINQGHWSDYGVCLNPGSPLCGYPVHTGRDCIHYRVRGTGDFTRAT